MKSLLIATILILSSTAFAAPTIFRANLKCVGKIMGDTSQVHESYYKLGMNLRSFQSTKRNGSKVDSLEVSNYYGGPKEAIDFTRVSETWYMGPMTISGKKVTRKDLSGRGDDLNLEIVNTSRSTGKTTIKLIGKYANPNSVAGSYGYTLECVGSLN